MRFASYTIVLFKQFMITAGSVATTGHDERQVMAQMGVGVLEVATPENAGAVEQRLAVFLHRLQGRHQLTKRFEISAVQGLVLRHFLGRFAVVRQAVIALGNCCFHPALHGRRAGRTHKQGNRPA